ASQRAVVRPGRLVVSGTDIETHSVLDALPIEGLVNFRPTNSVTELLPGTYTVLLNGLQQRVEVTAGQQAVARAGSLIVSGTGKETGSVLASTAVEGRLSFRPTNPATELLPARY